MAKSRPYNETLREILNDPEEATEYLNVALEEGRSRHPRPLVPDAVYLLHPWSPASRDISTSLYVSDPAAFLLALKDVVNVHGGVAKVAQWLKRMVIR